MSWMRFFRRARWDTERSRELESYLEIETDDNIARGMRPDAARRAAHRKLGNSTRVREEIYRMNTIGFLDTLVHDLCYAFRALVHHPAFAAIAVLTLALGIGANTAIFSVVNTFLIRPLPYPEPERLVSLFERNVINDEPQMLVAPGNFLDWQKTATSFERMAAYWQRIATLSSGNPDAAPERVFVCACSGSLFETLGVTPAAGRLFNPDEDRSGAPRVVVIGYDLWRRHYAGAADAIGKLVRLNGEDFEVIGVMPRGFLFPNRQVEVWWPMLTVIPLQEQTRHDLHNLQVVARLHEGVSIERAFAELDGIAARYKKDHPEEATGRGANVLPLHGQLVRTVRAPLIVLLGAVGCVLLIACVNIASLTLTRAAARTREIGIRAALGAGRGRIVRQLLAESVILALAGGALGAVLAVSITDLLLENAPAAATIVPTGSVPVDPVVFLFAFGIAVLSSIGVGLFPAIRVSRSDLANDLKSGGRSSTATRSHGRLRNGLVSAEVALSVVLLIASGLLMRSFFLLYQVRPGLRVDHTLTLNVSAPFANYREPAQRSALLAQLGERVQRIPGVRSAGLISCPPLTGACSILFYYVEGRPFVSGKFEIAHERTVDPTYFAAAGIPLVRGRTFTKQDGVGFDPDNPRLGSIVISEHMAKTEFPGEDPIGRRIFFDFEFQGRRGTNRPVPRYEVIGVVGDVLSAIDAQSLGTLYRPLLDVASPGATVLLHTAVEPKSVTSAVRDAIREIDPGLAVYRFQTLEELISASTAARQFNMLLFAAFAGLALLLAAIGLYGLVSYAVSQRQAEIGIRIALGATGADVNKMVLFQGLKPALVGVALGLVAAAFATKVLRSQLFGVTPADPLTFAVVPLVLLAIAALACCLPARRATRLDPIAALRAE